MADIEWYGPERGKGSVGDIVSHLPGVKMACDVKARAMGRQAEAALMAHRRHGHAHVEVDRHPNPGGDTPDWYIYLRDRDPGGNVVGVWKNVMDRSAMSIEFGWVTKKGKRVDGLHILGNTIKRNQI